MTTSRTAHKCYACPKTIEAGESFNSGRRGKKTCNECHDRRKNRRMNRVDDLIALERKKAFKMILWASGIILIMAYVPYG